MRTLSLNMTMRAVSSLSHNGGESHGTETLFRRVKIIDAESQEAEVPEISGNAMRGLLRDLANSHLCRALGFGEDGAGLPLPAFHFLFSGGGLHAASNGLQIAQYKLLRDTIPTVSIFGGGIGNALLPGKLRCGHGVLVCAENKLRLPVELRDHPLASRSMYEYLSTVMNVRKDDSKDVRKHPLIEAGARKFLEAAQDAKLKAKIEGEVEAASPRGASTQMMYTTEVIIAGSLLSWRIHLDDVTELEWEAFLCALAELRRKPWIGGKSGTGHGEIELHCDSWEELNSQIAPKTEAVSAPVGALYAKHVAERRNDILAVLQGIQ
jgi:CRISPR type IV-associated protein Csf2